MISPNGNRSQLNSVFNAALTAYFANPRDYRDLYRSYLGVEPKFIPASETGGWVDVELGTLSRVLTRGVLRFGYAEGPPYVYHGANGELTGLEWELGNQLTAIIRSYYSGYAPGKGLRAEWVRIEVTASGDPERARLDALYAALKEDRFDVALSGQANLSADPTAPAVEWTSPTELLFTNILYSGRGEYDLKGLVGGSRAQFIDTVKKWPDVQMMCVVNLGPSRTNTLKLVEDIRAQGGTVTLKDDCTVEEITKAIKDRAIHFSVGDAVASAWQGVQPGFPGLNLNITAALDPLGTAQRVAAFTLRPK
ncbi:hypothetical protein [Pyxidicoccus sp. MSG2]|uniref:hypothetical protein n=1 Tax=Pyxidicoccus sp. MSG2 TaxID=2996790 RepID=UPI00226FD66F|nr:hypothetical protein [Pyxidicoccus sp. MSG2]MCY1014489.1 hypothetical protein [Pyxidicoccus sp. MSG2]